MRKKQGPIHSNTRIDQMLREHPETAGVLESHGLNCRVCALISMATVALGAERHNLKLDKLLEELNDAILKHTS